MLIILIIIVIICYCLLGKQGGEVYVDHDPDYSDPDLADPDDAGTDNVGPDDADPDYADPDHTNHKYYQWIEAEAWQMGLYGPGGHYLPHYDAFDTLVCF